MDASILTKHVFVFQLHNKSILYDQELGTNKDHCKCDYKSMCQCASLVDLKPLDPRTEAILTLNVMLDLAMCAPDLCTLQKILTSLK